MSTTDAQQSEPPRPPDAGCSSFGSDAWYESIAEELCGLRDIASIVAVLQRHWRKAEIREDCLANARTLMVDRVGEYAGNYGLRLDEVETRKLWNHLWLQDADGVPIT